MQNNDKIISKCKNGNRKSGFQVLHAFALGSVVVQCVSLLRQQPTLEKNRYHTLDNIVV